MTNETPAMPGSGRGRRSLPLLLLAILTLAATRADAPAWVSLSEGGYAFASAVAADHEGNLYVTGGFGGTVRFGDRALVARGERVTATDVFLVSHDPAGRVRWVVKGGSDVRDAGLFVAAGRTGIHVAGFIGGTADFGASTGASAPIPGSVLSRSLVLAKYDFSGNLLWVRTVADSGTIGPEGLAIDDEENVYVFGYFEKCADFGATRLEKEMSKNLFLARYSPDGELEWARQITGGHNFITGPRARGLAIGPDGRLYLTGTLSGVTRFGTRRHETSKTRYSARSFLHNTEIFVARYSLAGELDLLKIVAVHADVADIRIAPDGAILLAGAFKGMASGPKRGAAQIGGREIVATRDPGGEIRDDIILARFDPEYKDAALALAVDAAGNASITGHIDQTAEIGGERLTVIGGEAWKLDIFAATFDPRGRLLAVRQAGGPSTEKGDGIAVDSRGRTFVTGTVRGEVAFGAERRRAGTHGDVFLVAYPAPESAAAGAMTRGGGGETPPRR
jgi:hypothetical protein